jgi:hypothetical protein
MLHMHALICLCTVPLCRAPVVAAPATDCNQYLGCYVDGWVHGPYADGTYSPDANGTSVDQSYYTLPHGGGLSPNGAAQCGALARSLDFLYFGTQWTNDCWAGNSYARATVGGVSSLMCEVVWTCARESDVGSVYMHGWNGPHTWTTQGTAGADDQGMEQQAQCMHRQPMRCITHPGFANTLAWCITCTAPVTSDFALSTERVVYTLFITPHTCRPWALRT